MEGRKARKELPHALHEVIVRKGVTKNQSDR